MADPGRRAWLPVAALVLTACLNGPPIKLASDASSRQTRGIVPTMRGEPAEPRTRPSGIDPHGRLTVSVPCATCGYDLRTLAYEGVCPECGKPVRESVTLSALCNAELLRVASLRPWLRWTARALTIFAALPVCGLIGVSLLLVLLIDDNLLGSRLIRGEQAFWLIVFSAWALVALGLFVGLLSLPLMCVSLWMLAKAPDGWRLPVEAAAARRWLLITTPLVAVCLLVGMFVSRPRELRLAVALAGAAALVSCLKPIGSAISSLWAGLGAWRRALAVRTSMLLTSLLAGLLAGCSAYLLLNLALRGSELPARVGEVLFFATLAMSPPALVGIVVLVFHVRRLHKFAARLRTESHTVEGGYD